MADRRNINRDIPPPAMGDLQEPDQQEQEQERLREIAREYMRQRGIPIPPMREQDFEPFPVPPGHLPGQVGQVDQVGQVGQEGQWQEVEFPTQATEAQMEDLRYEDNLYRRNMWIEVCNDSKRVREAYYSGMLPGWKDLTVQDHISLEDRLLPEHIAEDGDNLVFIVFNKDRSVRLIFPSTRKVVEQTQPMYECEDDVDSMNRTYIPLNQIGAPFGGVSDYHMTKRIVVNTNYQVFFLRELPKDLCFLTDMNPKSARLVSHGVKHWGFDATSDSHCQDDTQRTIYQIHVPSFYY